jgi:4-alpha-glucanotransferase
MKPGRLSGVLLHPTSLPSPWGVGDLGPAAYRFVDLMSVARQSLWEILPLTPVGDNGSPYSAHSLFAGNPLLLSPEVLVRDGYLRELPSVFPQTEPGTVDYPSSIEFKDRLVESAYNFSFEKTKGEKDYLEFCGRNGPWLDDYAMYEALTRSYGRPWVKWPEELRRRDKAALEEKTSALAPLVQKAKFSQYLFQRQWTSLKAHAFSKGIRILGDVPFYVLADSSDIWAHPEFFRVDAQGGAVYVGGVPPDYFSKTGQRWGNPVYNWQRMEETGYSWWKGRVSRGLELSDFLRLDHFRGYVAYWEIQAESATAEIGKWVPLPQTFLDAIKSSFPDLPFVAEDLGVITDDVRRAIDLLGIPGIRVLQFGFDGSSDNPHLPSNHARNSLVCTGTHDTNTTLGWFTQEATSKEKSALEAYLGHAVSSDSVCRDFKKMAVGSVSDICILPFQDVLGLGADARMNNPGTSTGNWRWRALPVELSEGPFRTLEGLAVSSGRG